jgi:hypothetical protein
VTLREKTKHLLQHLPLPLASRIKQPDLQLGEKGTAKKPKGEEVEMEVLQTAWSQQSFFSPTVISRKPTG